MQTVWRMLAALVMTAILSLLVVAPFAWFEGSKQNEQMLALPILDQDQYAQEFPPPPAGPFFNEPFNGGGREPGEEFHRPPPPPPRREGRMSRRTPDDFSLFAPTSVHGAVMAETH